MIMRNSGDIKTKVFLICSTKKGFLPYVNSWKYQMQWHQIITETYLLSNITHQVMSNPFCKVSPKVPINAFIIILMPQAKCQKSRTYISCEANNQLYHIMKTMRAASICNFQIKLNREHILACHYGKLGNVTITKHKYCDSPKTAPSCFDLHEARYQIMLKIKTSFKLCLTILNSVSTSWRESMPQDRLCLWNVLECALRIHFQTAV